MQRLSKLVCIVTVCLMIISLCSGCGVLQKLGLQKNDNDELHPVSSIVMNEDEAKKLTDKVPIHLYFANAENTKLKLEVRYIPLSEAKKTTTSLAATIVNELIKGPGGTSGLKATIPEGTKLRSINIKGNVATVDFSKEFKDKHTGGEAAERMTLFSVVNSLTELKEIEKVKFTINGKLQSEFKGSFKLDAPFPRMASLISKSVSLPNTVTAGDTKDQTKKTEDKTKKNDSDKKTNTKENTNPKENTNTKDKKSDNSSVSQTSNEQNDDAEGVYQDSIDNADTLE